ncbi:MAG TPA: 2-hydroxyacid dehydrogenase [Treponemataceae bacterium]|nr:2-hydroxyacid dehydrogenase [Treponemataceae bacterium]
MNDKTISVAVFDAKPYDIVFFNKANEKYGYDLHFFEFRLKASTAHAAKGFDVVCAFVNDAIDEKTVNILKEHNVQLITMRCAGYNNLDLKALFNTIHVTRVPAYSPYSVAEHAVSLLLALTRKIPQAFNRTKNGNFTLVGLTGRDMHGRTIGIVGTGKIEKIMADIAKGFGMNILLFDVFPDQAWAKNIGAEYVSKERLFKESDVITLHCPLTPETRHFVDLPSIELMKNDAVIINTGRGALIDTKALVHALKHKLIGGAALDVYEEEDKYFFEDWSTEVIEDDTLARLMTFPNVIITSHQAFLTQDALESIAHTSFENIRAYFAGEALENEICYQCGQNRDSCTHAKTGRCF